MAVVAGPPGGETTVNTLVCTHNLVQWRRIKPHAKQPWHVGYRDYTRRQVCCARNILTVLRETLTYIEIDTLE
jgi:hypothetical protein